MSKFGCIKDKFDDRDYLMRAYLPVVKLPKKIDYTSKMSLVADQGDQEGSTLRAAIKVLRDIGVCIEKYMMDAWSTVDFDDPNPMTLASVLRSIRLTTP